MVSWPVTGMGEDGLLRGRGGSSVMFHEDRVCYLVGSPSLSCSWEER